MGTYSECPQMGIGAKSNFVASIVSYLHAFNTHYIKKKQKKQEAA